MSDREQHVKTLEDALNLALKALEAISDEMTVGERYTNAGQHLFDALQPCRNALQAAAPAQEDARDTERLDWLTFNLSGSALRAIGVVWSEHADARRAIDAARAAQGEF